MFHMVVESIFHIDGQGTVLAGVVESGVVGVGDAVEVRSPNQAVRSRVVGIEADRESVHSAKAGDQVAVLLRGFSPESVADGLKRVGDPPAWQVVELALHGVPKPWWQFW